MPAEEEKRELALFRFSMIAPVVNDTYREESKMAYFRAVTEAPSLLPNGKLVRFAPMTIKKWYQKYTSGGLEALIPKARFDLGQARVLTEDAKNQIQAYLDTFPRITGRRIYEKLIEEGYIKKTDFSVDTLYRYLNHEGIKQERMGQEECLAYELPHANDCWQSDTTMGPVIVCGGQKRQTYLIAAIDDASRLLVHGEFFFEDNAKNVQHVLKKGIQKFGLPRMFFADNGSPYRNLQLEWICAAVGIEKIHSKPYHPKGRGKIERSHRTAKDRWMNATDWNEFHTLEEVNESYHAYLDKEYNNDVHSVIQMTPRERYLQDFKRIKFIETSILEEQFLHRITRKVTQCATISLFKKCYETPQQYVGQTVHLRYDPQDMGEVYIYSEPEGRQLHVIRQVQKADNAKRIRKPAIDYGKMR